MASANATGNGHTGPVYNLQYVPDGIFYFEESNSSSVNYRANVMDFPTNNFHRLNGISYIRFSISTNMSIGEEVTYSSSNDIDQELKRIRSLFEGPGTRNLESKNETFNQSLLIVPEGFLQMMDTVTKGFMGAINAEAFGFFISYMPITVNTANFFYSLLNVVASSFYPFALALV